MMMTAVISACETYRYELVRIWDESLPLLSIIMVNPSTADHRNNDATIVKVIEFAKRLGYGGVIVVNIFAFRATDVNELKTAADPVGPHNMGYILAAMLRTSGTIVAWGASAKLPVSLRDHWRPIADMAHAIERPLYCFGTCNDGHPKHPVMLGYTTPLIKWSY